MIRAPPTPTPLSPDGSEWSGYSHYHNSALVPPSPGRAPPLRHNTATPPVSGSSAGGGQQMRSSSGLGPAPPPIRNGGGASPPASIGGRSSFGTQASSSEVSRRFNAQMEDRLQQHYGVLKRFLGQALRDEKGNLRPNRARDKLFRLTPIQFQELSTDVYDELLRRQHAQKQTGQSPVPPYLLPRENFHPKRNQARQKLATLPPSRFRDLATDVLYELERRFPHFLGRPASPLLGLPSRAGTPNGFGPGLRTASLEDPQGRPTAKQFQSNTIIPNKSTMVEDNDDDALSDFYGSHRDTARSGGNGKIVAEYEAQIEQLQERLHAVEDSLSVKDVEREEMTKRIALYADLEAKLQNAQSLNENLELELSKIRSEHTSSERELKAQIREDQERFDQSHRALKAEMAQQKQLTSQVRQEAVESIKEMRILSHQTSDTLQREETLATQVRHLEDELEEWKARYVQIKTAKQSEGKRHVNVAVGEQIVQEKSFHSATGLIPHAEILLFQLALDDLLQTARGGPAHTVLAKVKKLIVIVRRLALATIHAPEDAQQARARLQATANNLITACRNFALSQGLSPVSLLDAAASHLSLAVIELAKLVKIQPGTEITDNPHRDVPPTEASNGETATVEEPALEYAHLTGNLGQLSTFLDSRTTVLLTTLQSLVSGIRTSASSSDILDIVQSITSTTGQIVAQTRNCVPGNTKAASVAHRLMELKHRLEDKGREGEMIEGTDRWDSFVKDLPPLGFEIARQVKEVGVWVETGLHMGYA